MCPIYVDKRGFTRTLAHQLTPSAWLQSEFLARYALRPHNHIGLRLRGAGGAGSGGGGELGFDLGDDLGELMLGERARGIK